jgi:hypothetical protein
VCASPSGATGCTVWLPAADRVPVSATAVRAPKHSPTHVHFYQNERTESYSELQVACGGDYVMKRNFVLFTFAATAPPPLPVGQGLLIHKVSRPQTTTHQSVGLLWTSDQLVAETSTSQHTTLTTDRYPCPRWDSSPQSQQTSGRRATP